MPTYEYECTKCGDKFEALQKISDEAIKKCKKCKGKVIKKYVQDNEYLVDCEIWFENQLKEITVSGSATVKLPHKSAQDC